MTDNILPLPARRNEIEEQVFEIGESTIRVLRNQPFAFEEYGTRDSTSISPLIATATEEPQSGDPLVRVEQKIDAALGAIKTLQKRIDSIDAVLAVVINR